MGNHEELEEKIARLEYDNYVLTELNNIVEDEHCDAIVLIREFINASYVSDLSSNEHYQECLSKAREYTKKHDCHVIWIPKDILKKNK